MPSNQEAFLLLRKVEDMIKYSYICLCGFPKTEKYTLAAEIKRCMYAVLRLNIEANKRYYKKTTIRDMDVEMEMLKHLVRMACDLRFLARKHAEAWQAMNVEIGRIIGGWLKASSGRASVGVVS